MRRRKIYDREGHAHFVTFSCYKRRRLLDSPRAARIVLGVLASQLAKQSGVCIGFVIMPDHVHAVLWFLADGQLSHFMKQWKQRSSVQIKKFLRARRQAYLSRISVSDPVWQPRYYSFNLYDRRKVEARLVYMHANPFRAGLVENPANWPYSSARWYESQKSVGVSIGFP